MECFNCLVQQGMDEDASSSLTIQNLRSFLSTVANGETPQFTSESPEKAAWVRGLMTDENVPPLVKMIVCSMKVGPPSGWADVMASPSWRHDLSAEIADELNTDLPDVRWMSIKGDLGWGMGQGVDINSICIETRPSSDTSPIEWPEICAWIRDAFSELKSCSDRTTSSIREFWPDFDPELMREGA